MISFLIIFIQMTNSVLFLKMAVLLSILAINKLFLYYCCLKANLSPLPLS